MRLQAFCSRILSFRYDATAASWCLLFVLSAYIYQAMLPAFNADDIIQIQEASNDSYTFLSSGRWGYFLIFNKLLDANPGGLFSTLLGTVALFFSATQAANFVGLQHGISRLLFIALSCVSFYYGALFAFDSTRLAYPIAICLAISGLTLLSRQRYIVACLVMAISPAFYQSAIQVAATVFIMACLYGVLVDNARGRISHFVAGVLTMAAALVLYLLATKLAYGLLGITMNSRMSVNLMSVWDNRAALTELFLHSSVPFLSGHYTYYVGQRLVWPIGLLFCSFTVVALWRLSLNPRFVRWVFAAFLTVLSFLAPFALAFAANEIVFPLRSLIAFASLHAAWAAITIELLIDGDDKLGRWRSYAAMAVVFMASFLALSHHMQINKKALDDYLVSQEDLLATNRIIYRIEEVVADDAQFPQAGPIPLAVVYTNPLPAGARGDVGTARMAPWAKEWIFRLIDHRFVVAPQDMQDKAYALAEGRRGWPARDSVFVADGTVIVLINR